MSKELEALQKLRDLVEYLTRIDYVPTALRNEVTIAVLKAYGLHSFDNAKVEDVINCLVEHYDEIENIISEYQK